ncbi:hypothetical protein Dimus_019350 [Dionaea muscipula]
MHKLEPVEELVEKTQGKTGSFGDNVVIFQWQCRSRFNVPGDSQQGLARFSSPLSYRKSQRRTLGLAASIAYIAPISPRQLPQLHLLAPFCRLFINACLKLSTGKYGQEEEPNDFYGCLC